MCTARGGGATCSNSSFSLYRYVESIKRSPPPSILCQNLRCKNIYILKFTLKSPPEESVTTSLISQHAVVSAVLLNCAHTLCFLGCKKWKWSELGSGHFHQEAEVLPCRFKFLKKGQLIVNKRVFNLLAQLMNQAFDLNLIIEARS